MQKKKFFKTHFIFRWIKLNVKSLFAQMQNQMHTTVKSNLAKNIGEGFFKVKIHAFPFMVLHFTIPEICKTLFLHEQSSKFNSFFVLMKAFFYLSLNKIATKKTKIKKTAEIIILMK